MNPLVGATLAVWALNPSQDGGLSPRDSDRNEQASLMVGYTDMRCDDPKGQFYNWRTQRAFVVGADGSNRREVGASLIARPDGWTQFAGWWPDGRAIVLSCWEEEDNYRWEREHQTFRMTEGWMVDCCLVELRDGSAVNLTAVDRVSIYNTGLFPWTEQGGGLEGSRAGFNALIGGKGRPFVMDMDGGNKRDLSEGEEGFTYGYSASPDGRSISYHKDYKVFVADHDGSNMRRVDRDSEFQFCPVWSPDGAWVLFLAGEHYDCHPHVVKADGTGLRKLADRGEYMGVVEVLDVPDFHSASSDVPVWSPDSQWVYFTAKVRDAVELMRVSIEGETEQLTRSRPGVLHYHPRVSPDGQWIAFGSTREGARALFVSRANGTQLRAITETKEGRAQMHAHWAEQKTTATRE